MINSQLLSQHVHGGHTYHTLISYYYVSMEELVKQALVICVLYLSTRIWNIFVSWFTYPHKACDWTIVVIKAWVSNHIWFF